jgi:hypothetical protein
VSETLAQVINRLELRSVLAVGVQGTLGPPLNRLPVFSLLAADRGLAGRVEDRESSPLGKEGTLDRVHLIVVLDADAVVFIECRHEGVAAAVKTMLELSEHVVLVDRVSLVLEELPQLQRMTERFNELRKKAKIRAGRLHDVRRTHATHLLTRGIPVHIVAARLGHSSPVVTLNTYAHVLPTSDEQAAMVIAEVLRT